LCQGKWTEVVIDDRLPVSSSGFLLFCHNSKIGNDMLGALIEKAYAKLYSCYEFLKGGNIVDALIDLTGGIYEEITLSNLISTNSDYDQLWTYLIKCFKAKSFMGTVINSKKKKQSADFLTLCIFFIIFES
jgi:hypothetical protein